MLSKSPKARTAMEDNFWVSRGSPSDLDCPPSGRLLKVSYSNGDQLSIEFFEIESIEAARDRYSDLKPQDWTVSFPLTAVEVQMNVAGTDIRFGPRETTLPGGLIRGSFFEGFQTAIAYGRPS
jgi:hypothetical protein